MSTNNAFFSVGVDEDVTGYKRILIYDTNVYAVALCVFGLLLALIFSFYEYQLVWRSFAFILPALSAYIFNFLRQPGMARFLICVGTSALLANLHAYISVGDAGIIHQFLLFQFVVLLLPFIIIDAREQTLLVATFIFNLLIFLCFPLINNYINADFQSALLEGKFFSNFLLILNIAIAMIFMLHLHYNYFKAENRNQKLAEELDTKERELKEQEDELQRTFAEIKEKHKEDERRNWISSGISIVNKLLRSMSDETLYQKVISEMVKYLSAYQGVIYVLSKDHSELEIQGAYAGQRMHLEYKRFSAKEGYLGQVCFEKAPVYFKEIPEDYVHISSGLGESRPRSVLLMPMIQEGSLEGVIELSFFRELEQYERDFVEEAAGILARFIESYQVNHRTRSLLEETQQQTEEMRSQEEEMRQNMEELQATQEEMRRKEQEYLNRIEELENALQHS